MRIRQCQRFVAVVLWVVALLAGLSSRSAAAATGGSALTLGSGLSLGVLMPDVGDNITVFSAPEGNLFFSTAPGLRFGHVAASREFEFGLDTSMLFVNSSGSSGHALVFGADFQKHFVKASEWNAFIGADAGVLIASDVFLDATAPYFGFMVGGRNIIANDHGSVKVAFHFRHHMEDEDSGLQSFNELALAMHFDLWIPQ